MSKTVSRKSTRMLAVVQSSRNIKRIDYDPEIDIVKSEFLYNRHSKSKSCIESSISFQIPPKPVCSQGTRSGYDLKFELSTKEEDIHVSKLTPFASKDMLQPPDHINILAVRYGLLRKWYVTNSASWQGRHYSDDAIVTPPELYDDDFRKSVTYSGELKCVGKSRQTHVAKPSEVQVTASIFANASSSTASDISRLWSWPWLMQSQRPSDLYLHTETEVNCLESQPDALPTLPCPLQARVLIRYLQSVQPCVTESQYKETKKLVEEFALNHGTKFHDMIVDLANSHDSWIEPILPNYNYCYSWEDAPLTSLGIVAPFWHDIWQEERDSLPERACLIIKIISEFWKLIRTEKLKTIVDDEGHCLNMSQFCRLFSSVKLPGIPFAAVGTVFKTARDGDTPRHIIVIHRGRIFTMTVVDTYFELLPLEEIKNSLNEILLFATKREDYPIGMLTAADMFKWTTLRQCLIDLSGNNESNLMQVEEAMFVLSLDHKNANGLDILANEALFADGCNRWYDKNFNIYVHHNGLVTVNVNRTLLDGPTVAHLLHYMHLRIVEEMEQWDNKAVSTESTTQQTANTHLSNFEEIQLEMSKLEELTKKTGLRTRLNSLTATETRALFFNVDDLIEEEIEQSAGRFDFLSSSLLTATCKNDTFASDFFSHYKVNKDAFAHMAIHLTFYTMYFRIATVGCRISLKKFQGTLYDTVRSTTPEMAEWCKAMLNSDADDDQRQKLFWKAEKIHRRLFHECYNGQGCDNYVNALYNLTEQHSLPDGCMFDDESFGLAGWTESYEINAESLGAGCTSCPVVLPTIPTGYGVGYSVATSFILFLVTSWEGAVKTNADLYAASLNLTVSKLFSCIARWS